MPRAPRRLTSASPYWTPRPSCPASERREREIQFRDGLIIATPQPLADLPPQSRRSHACACGARRGACRHPAQARGHQGRPRRELARAGPPSCPICCATLMRSGQLQPAGMPPTRFGLASAATRLAPAPSMRQSAAAPSLPSGRPWRHTTSAALPPPSSPWRRQRWSALSPAFCTIPTPIPAISITISPAALQRVDVIPRLLREMEARLRHGRK